MAVPPPPAARAPPPSQARAAFVAAAPDRAEIAVPVDAAPKVVATHMAALGATLATAAPAANPAPPPAADRRAASRSRRANSSTSRNSALSTSIRPMAASKDFGVLAMLLTSASTCSIRSVDRSRWRRSASPASFIPVYATLYAATASS